jgi:hypothetical protein
MSNDGGLNVLNQRSALRSSLNSGRSNRGNGNAALRSALSSGTGNSMSNIGTDLLDQNKDAAKLAAELEVGKTATALVASQLKGRLPEALEAYSEHPVFNIAVANATAAAIKHFCPCNNKAVTIADAMVQSSMVEMVASFDVAGMVEELVSGINVLPMLTGNEEG